jgi:pyridoxal phosphate enzyme (YggS family)
MAQAAERLSAILRRVAAAVERVGRNPDDIELIAVAKTFGAESIAPLLEAGHRSFGENRVQEAQAKWPKLRERWPDIRLHLIGPLQTNKVRDAVALFDAIHSVDRDKLAGAIAKEMARQGRDLTLFVEVNTGDEAQKSGVAPLEAPGFVRRCREVHSLAVAGLMCIPPLTEDPAPHFDMLRRVAEKLDLGSLSMGMSADFELAIAHGATHVRVGSAIFGER